jgi:cyclopropane-fatty-acyl-phospholipid synthase
MALAITGPLRRELARVFPSRPFSVRFWDQTAVPATVPGSPEFVLRSPVAVAHFVRAPGQLGLGRAYVSGALVVDDLDAAFQVVDEWRPARVTRRDRGRLTAAVLAASGLAGLPRRPALELILRGSRHSVERDRAAVRYHYDVGNEFFALFLDPSMTYSCAIFSRGARTLEEAQEAKLELVARKLALKEEDRVLDVGCGWGSFAIHAATSHGARVVGITLSVPQAEEARRRVAHAGVEDRVEIRVADYRELAGESFDAVASVGMVEHVGASQIDRYAQVLAGLLRPGGVLLNHGIAVLNPDSDPGGGPFSRRYVFPDGEPLPLSRVEQAMECAGLVTEHVEGFAADYAQTLRHWIARLDDRLEEAIRLAGEDRTRVWRLYLRAARHGFDSGFTSVYQILARRGTIATNRTGSVATDRSGLAQTDREGSVASDGSGSVAPNWTPPRTVGSR